MLFSCFSTGFSASPPSLAARSRVAVSPVSMKWGEHLGEREWNHGPDGRASQLTRDHGKLVITLATTGNINTRENNAALPCSPKEMADDMHECIKLGVSILHIHSRNELLKPTMRVDKFRETCRLVKERDPDVIIQISTGGRAPLDGVDVGTWRMDPLNLLPEMGAYTPTMSEESECVICFDDARLGVRCNGSVSHFVCAACLNGCECARSFRCSAKGPSF